MNWLVVWMSVSDLLISGTMVFGPAFTPRGALANPFLCSLQGFLITVGGLGSAFWNGLMSLHLLISIYRAVPIVNLDPLFKYYHATAWGVPIICALIPLIHGFVVYGVSGFGDAKLWCWVTEPLLQMLAFYMELWMTFIFTLVVYTLILLRLGKQNRVANSTHTLASKGDLTNNSSRAGRRLILKTLIYALIFVICWAPATANRLIGLSGGKSPYELNLTHTSVVPIQGFLNAINFFVFSLLLRPSPRKPSLK
ncbi:MAG: hypothetical protein SGCHY_003036 [Lobulomycetales sp.]